MSVIILICLNQFYVWSTLDDVPCSPTSVCSNHSLLYLFIEKVLRARILTVLFSLTPIPEVYNFCRFRDIIARRMELVGRNDLKTQMSICTRLAHLSAKFRCDKPTEHCTSTDFLTPPRALQGRKKFSLLIFASVLIYSEVF